jgi:DNA-binding beta-propeller fold protein YncE
MQRQSDYVASVRRLAILLVCFLALLVGAASPSRADVATSLGFKPVYEPFMAVDPVGQHVFVAGGEATSSIYVFDFDGNLVKTITGENGASGMAVDTATHTLYVALFDATKVSEIDTQTLTETTRFTVPADTYDVALAGGKLWLAMANQVNSTIDYANFDGSDITPAGFGATSSRRSPLPVTTASTWLSATTKPSRRLWPSTTSAAPRPRW